jgi:purine-nucleoside phosphorylase
MAIDPAPLEAAVLAAAAAIRSRYQLQPLVGLVLGSGLGDIARQVSSPCAISFAEIPHHPLATVAGHDGQVVLGLIGSVPVAVWRGRVHFYEGSSMAEVGFPMRVLGALGARAVVLTNAAGGLNESFKVGDLMVLTDHINLPGLVGHNPLRGQDDGKAQRFLDLSEAYDPELRRLVLRAGEQAGIPLVEGVYAMVAGPNYETRAETRLLRHLGADAVGMSTVPEVIVARQVGLRVVALSAITNILLGPGARGGPSHAEVLASAERLKPRLTRLLSGMLSNMAEVLGR